MSRVGSARYRGGRHAINVTYEEGSRDRKKGISPGIGAPSTPSATFHVRETGMDG